MRSQTFFMRNKLAFALGLAAAAVSAVAQAQTPTPTPSPTPSATTTTSTVVTPAATTSTTTTTTPNGQRATFTGAETGDAGPFHEVVFTQGVGFRNPENTISVNMRFRIQNRADFFFDQTDRPNAPDLRTEWQTRRARLRFNGHVVNPRFRYTLQLSFSSADQDWDNARVPNVLRDAMLTYDVTPAWQVGFGQGKLPGNRQRVVSSGDLQFVDRSTLNARFNIDRDFGFQTQYTLELGEQLVIAKGAITSGESRNRNVRNENNPVTTARLEYLPFGKFERNGDYFESDLAFETTPKLSIGVSAATMAGAPRENGTIGAIFTTTGQQGGTTARRTQEVQFADLMFKYRGFSVLAEWAHRRAENPIVNEKQAVLNGWATNVQVGQMLTSQDEIAVRHSLIEPEDEVRAIHRRTQDWAMVYNRFLNGHRTKLQGEIGLQEAREAYARLQFELGI